MKAMCHMQGYGLTETCAASFISLPQQDNSGTVGPPTACTHAFELTKFHFRIVR